MTGTNSRGPGGHIPGGTQEHGLIPMKDSGSVAPGAMCSDNVNHPKHYNSHPSGVECITVARHMGFNLGNVMKYIWRSDHKGSTLEDLKKARFYLDDEIARIEGKDKT